MNEQKLKTAKRVLTAIKNDWVLFDEKDEDDFMVFVNENRDTHKILKPKRTFILQMKNKGLIEVVEKETKREYLKVRGVKKLFPLMALYRIREKGKELMAEKTD